LLPVFKEDGSEFNLTFDQILSLSATITRSKLKSAEASEATSTGLMSMQSYDYRRGVAMGKEATGEAFPPPAAATTSTDDWMRGYADQGASYREDKGEGQ